MQKLVRIILYHSKRVLKQKLIFQIFLVFIALLQMVLGFPPLKNVERDHPIFIELPELPNPHILISEIKQSHKSHASSSMETFNNETTISTVESTTKAFKEETIDERKEKLNAQLQKHFTDYENGKKKEKDDE